MRGSRLKVGVTAIGLAAAMAVAGCSNKSGTSGGGGDVGPCQTTPPDPTCSKSCTGATDCGSGFYCDTGGTCTAQCGPNGGCPSTFTCDTATGKCTASSGPCAGTNPPADCGKTCLLPAACNAPTYCDHYVCTAQCDPSSSSNSCGTGMTCDQSGKCVTVSTNPDGGLSDACQPTVVMANPVVPTIVLIVDQSGSMTTTDIHTTTDPTSPTESRWQAVTDAIVGTNGVVTQLGNVARFGMMMYTATNGGNSTAPAIGTCPETVEVDPALPNVNPIQTAFMNNNPVEDTPTGDTIAYVTNTWLPSFSQLDRSNDADWTWNGDPIIYILATDGEPDMCADGDPTATSDTNMNGIPDAQEARQLVTDNVTAAHNHGIDTYVISVAVGSTTQAHLDAVATAGGTNCDPNPPDGGVPHAACPANYVSVLSDTLQSIVTGQISCDITLNGRIENTSTVCTDGQVRLVAGGTSMNLACQGDCATASGDGWCDVDDSHIRLIGSACQTLQGGQAVSVSATFACGTFTGT